MKYLELYKMAEKDISFAFIRPIKRIFINVFWKIHQTIINWTVLIQKCSNIIEIKQNFFFQIECMNELLNSSIWFVESVYFFFFRRKKNFEFRFDSFIRLFKSNKTLFCLLCWENSRKTNLLLFFSAYWHNT